ncbi:MAG: DOMON-like domain-containing protein [Alphaproteobacteria bacterium]|nr:DOMON-like domain-containing protein [Alphaproteobacteria bacterium]MBL6936321.1 DOMON-like domain-containing protein [Alphaproteobacteria bacterium]MBL7098628.1 DOMON-like domain-containing protein [Alphaproteobacteria bacterium]
MQDSLALHPDFRCEAVTAIDVEVVRSGTALTLAYTITGRIGALKLPSLASPDRIDELWKHTCLEAFVRPKGGSAYCEFNLAPSSRWAAYRFDDYRAGMRNAALSLAPAVSVAVSDTRLEVTAHLLLDKLEGFADVPWRLGLTAVIEELSGAKSYWSLKHPTGRPDFHHSDGFAIEIPAA